MNDGGAQCSTGSATDFYALNNYDERCFCCFFRYKLNKVDEWLILRVVVGSLSSGGTGGRNAGGGATCRSCGRRR